MVVSEVELLSSKKYACQEKSDESGRAWCNIVDIVVSYSEEKIMFAYFA